jgi:hypothetical protein
MATTTHVPVEVYLRSSYEPDAEYVDGKEIRIIDPQDSTFYRYEDGQLLRYDTFPHTGMGIVFEMNQIKDLLDV